MVNVDNRPGPNGPREKSNSSLYFIVGALVIAVLLIGWFMLGGDDTATDVDNVTVEEPVAPAAGDDIDVTVDPIDPAPEGDTNVIVEPSEPADPVEPAEPPAAIPEPTEPPAADIEPVEPVAPTTPQ